MKFCFGVMVACVMASGLVQAQERSAAGALDTQMTWSALKGLVDDANMKSQGALEELSKVTECGKLGKVYAPGMGTDGCLTVTAPAPTCQIVITTPVGNQHSLTCPTGTTMILKDFAVINPGGNSGKDAGGLQNQTGKATYGCQKIVCQ